MSIFDNKETKQARSIAKAQAKEQIKAAEKQAQIEAKAAADNYKLAAKLEEERAENDHRRMIEQQRELRRLELEAEKHRERQERERQKREKEERERGAAVYDPDGNRIMGTYIGETQNEKPFGKGALYYDNGYKYEGEFANAFYEGEGILTDSDDRIVYEGFWKRGYYQGQGKLYQSDGSTYIGSFFKGKKNGRGTLTTASGEIIEGQWSADNYYDGGIQADKPHGKGKMIFANNDIYDGEWHLGEKSGYGIYTFANGDIYEGYFKNDKINGKGTMHYANRCHYEGDWISGKPSGQGLMKYANGEEYNGCWKNGKPFGQGTMLYKNGDIYNGSWDVIPNGNGVMQYANGDEFEGQWVQGKKEGLGKMTYSDNSVYYGLWKDDEKSGLGIFSQANGQIQKCYWENDKAVSTLMSLFDRKKTTRQNLIAIAEYEKSLRSTQESTRNKRSGKNPLKIVSIVLLFAVVVVAVLFVFVLSSNDTKTRTTTPSTTKQTRITSVVQEQAALKAQETNSQPIQKPAPISSQNKEYKWINGAKYEIIPITNCHASSTLPPMGKYTYEAGNLTDGNLKTAWAMKRSNGQYLTFTISDTVHMIGVYNGYIKTDVAFYNNDRVAQVQIYVDNSSIGTITLKDSKECQYYQLSANTGQTFKFYLQSFYEGNKYDDVNITEIQFFKRVD